MTSFNRIRWWLRSGSVLACIAAAWAATASATETSGEATSSRPAPADRAQKPDNPGPAYRVEKIPGGGMVLQVTPQLWPMEPVAPDRPETETNTETNHAR